MIEIKHIKHRYRNTYRNCSMNLYLCSTIKFRIVCLSLLFFSIPPNILGFQWRPFVSYDDLNAVSERWKKTPLQKLRFPTLFSELCLQRAVERHSIIESYEAVEALSFDRMRSAHHSSLGNGLVLDQSRLHLRRTQ